MTTQDVSLSTWQRVEGSTKFESILLGNGASQAIWARFGYSTLFEQAPLDDQDRRLFEARSTTNFEQVLWELIAARRILDALGHDSQFLVDRYRHIREALAAAVHHVHLPWELLGEGVKIKIAGALSAYEYVFSTNYDLIVYWATRATELTFKDYFFQSTSDTVVFDSADTGVDKSSTKLVYLHGALHLVRSTDGSTHKIKWTDGAAILKRFGDEILAEGSVPLVVTEGGPDEKLTTIRSSDYLSHGLGVFSDRDGPIVVFGHSLGPSDAHLLPPLQQNKFGRPRVVAISMRPGDTARIAARKQEWRAKLPAQQLIFFDATTHPLGDPSLQVPDEDPATDAAAR